MSVLNASSPAKGEIKIPVKPRSPNKTNLNIPSRSPCKSKVVDSVNLEPPSNKRTYSIGGSVGKINLSKSETPSPEKFVSPVKCKTLKPPSSVSDSESTISSRIKAAPESKTRVVSPTQSGPASKKKELVSTETVSTSKGEIPISGSTSKRKALSITDCGSASKRKTTSTLESGLECIAPNHAKTGPASEAAHKVDAHPSGENGITDYRKATHSSKDTMDLQSKSESDIFTKNKSESPTKCSPLKKIQIQGICEMGQSSEIRTQGLSECGPSAQSTSSIPGASLSIRDHRIRCSSKQIVQEVLSMCTEFSKEIVESQQNLSEERRERVLRNSIWDFERSFHENITIDGQDWYEAPDTQNEPDIKILEDKLDDAIVETALKRKRYPRKILNHVIKTLKLEREILVKSKPVVKVEQMKLDSEQPARMLDLTAATSSLSKQISETMKALPTQIEKAEGFSQVLSLQPILENSKIHREIFCSKVKLVDLAKTLPSPTEATPAETGQKPCPAVSWRRQSSFSSANKLYPLRSKRKISLSL
ncbi:hypothetical protein GDO86_009060 [Hymenochirus boettgeri]|uniref:Uncharacterized protein n=1 Tax=Hymenochirus boettgeri TaxID=247094 RepID=A0A8T2JF03_9PIPI|nr:hypothetical protein GDO86_009060 [Hymenochirus boettgeri]KAG8443740.1 hypothetical protein GDO86_009060 [Hymenochirus boettgeri]